MTAFDSCSGGCAVTNVGSTVTWSLGTLAPNTTATRTLTVRVRTYIDQCQICNVAKLSSPDYLSGAAVSSAPACVSARPSSDPTDAVARGDAWGLKTYVPLLGLPLLNTTIAPTSSSQTSIGQSANSNEFLKLDIKDLAGLTRVARADVLRTTSSSQVNTQFGPRQTTTSEVLGLNRLNGLVTADVVRSVASTTATGSSSSFSAAGTTAANLRVAGNPVTNVAPGTRIPLNALLFGFDSYVAVNEQSGWTSRPAAGQTGGGRYKADLTVTMIRVRVTGGTVGSLFTLGGPPLEISVAKATAHSEHKQLRICTTAPTRAVSGHALIASAQVDPLLPTSTVGFVKVPATGGNGHMEVTGSVLPQDGPIVNTADAVSDATGTLGPISTSASSYAQVANACVLRIASAACLIKATLIRSQANSRMNGGGRVVRRDGDAVPQPRRRGDPDRRHPRTEHRQDPSGPWLCRAQRAGRRRTGARAHGPHGASDPREGHAAVRAAAAWRGDHRRRGTQRRDVQKLNHPEAVRPQGRPASRFACAQGRRMLPTTKHRKAYMRTAQPVTVSPSGPGASRRRSRFGALAVAASTAAIALVAVPGTALAGKPAPPPPPPPATPMTYAGSAYALSANVGVLGDGIQVQVGPISNTGELPPGGDMIDKEFVGLHTGAPLAINAGILDASTTGSGSRTISDASVLSADINIANLVTVGADVIQATAKASCANGTASYAGTSNLAALTIRALGLPVDLSVGTAPNTEIIVPGLARIVLNEQYISHGRLVVNALHIQVGGILAGLVTADVVISHAEAGISCGSGPGPCVVKDFVTGGGFITLGDGSKGTFGMVGGEKPNGLQGHLNYIDHKTGQHVKGTSVTNYAILSPTERRVTYAGTVDGAPTTIVVRVADNGEPGGNVDTFSISSPLYSADGPKITRGNIQLHQPGGCTTTSTKPGKGKP